MTRRPSLSARRSAKPLLALAIVLLAFNLRPLVTSVGALLQEVREALGMSPTTVGVLTTLPVLAFAACGVVAPWLGQRFGLHRVTLVSLVALVVGLLVRPFSGSAAVFLALTFLALAGTATANVYLPSLVKQHFPRRIGQLTAAYTTAIALGIALGSAVTVPIAEYVGSWGPGLLAWGVLAAVAVLPWLLLTGYDRGRVDAVVAISVRQVARTRLGWAMVGFFACQSLQAFAVFGWFAQIYRDAGFSATTSGLLLGVITATGIPVSLWLPGFAARLESQAWLMLGLAACYPVGYLGLLVAPVQGAWVWAVVIGLSMGAFPLILTLIGLRARTTAGTVALSGFTQSIGYALAAAGPFSVGLLYDLTGGWAAPLILLTVLAIPQAITGLMISRPVYLEDELS